MSWVRELAGAVSANLFAIVFGTATKTDQYDRRLLRFETLEHRRMLSLSTSSPEGQSPDPTSFLENVVGTTESDAHQSLQTGGSGAYAMAASVQSSLPGGLSGDIVTIDLQQALPGGQNFELIGFDLVNEVDDSWTPLLVTADPGLGDLLLDEAGNDQIVIHCVTEYNFARNQKMPARNR